MNKITYYKFLTADHLGPSSGFDWTPYLPTDDGQPGPWTPFVADLDRCNTGWHACEINDFFDWAKANLYELEYHPDALIVDTGDKVIGQQCRLLRRIETWNPRTQRLMAADYAESALPTYESYYPNDARVRGGLAVVRRYAIGQATDDELAAARAAASAAARAAASAAASAAARAAAWAAASAAAWAAASAAERAAAWAAAWATARAKQLTLLRWYLDGEIGDKPSLMLVVSDD